METISMSARERKRMVVLNKVASKEISLAEAANLIGVSYRQTKRIWSRFVAEGDQGVVHRGRGRPSNRQSPDGVKQQALELYQAKYSDYGPTLAAECMAEEDELEVSRTTLQRWLVSAGLWSRRRKRKKHRRRRPRREHLGELLQMDGSFHDWFEGRREDSTAEQYAGWATLMVLIDDATSRVFARFYKNESWHSATDLFRQYIDRCGLPRALYVDQHSIYRADREPTEQELLENQRPETQFGRSLRELDVKLILARSPQAKGRVERANGTLQDRLVKAMRRAGISEIAEANVFLEAFLPKFNKQFEKAPAKKADVHIPVSDAFDLGRILSHREDRVVQNDWTIRWKNRIMQLPREAAKTVSPGSRVVVCEQLDGMLRVFADDVELSWSDTRSAAPRTKANKPRTRPIRSNQGQKPGPDHPWRGRRKEPKMTT